ncbi:interleukin-27 subunit beta isoform X3 [Eumetopias jubatus]|uniref:interleukin-27 subunit beta isoform X3 n=1 Tax=Eumetopias jubatus TaxID=34886 RepID=UPI0010164D65|nr:interleukin-27 subunit beta isoform X3 [Eumetopias jubatus]
MASRLLLVLALWVGCSPCSGRKAAPTQPRVRCRASRYPIAVDCSWTLLPTARSAKPTSFIASYRSECPGGRPGVSHWGQDSWRPIKPDPPEGVRLSPLPGQRLWVQWEPPRSWPFPEIFSLKYWIRYKHHRSARFRQVGPIEATSFTLRAVRPQARYCIQVAAQDLTDYGEASDWSPPAAASKPMGK